MLELVRDLCRRRGLGYAWHTGSVPQQKRRVEIRAFKDDPACRVFLSTDSGGVGLNLQNASVVINCDLPWNPAKLEQRIARAWRKHQKNAVTVVNLIANETIEQRMLGTLAAKRSLADGVLDLQGDLDEIPLRPGGQSFIQRLEQTISAKPAVAPAPAAKSTPPADPGEAFAQRAAALLGARLVACQERFPDGPAGRVVVVTVEREADVWQPRLAEMHAALFAGREPAEPPRLEVLDRATAQALERLEAAGLIRTCVRATRHLHPVAAAIAPLTAEERARAAEFRQKAAKKLKLARILLAEEMADEADAALRESARLAGSAFAIEERLAEPPATFAAALAPPLDRRWGAAAAKLQPWAEGTSTPPPEIAEAIQAVLKLTST
jgi:hypothetical protein